MFVCVCVREKKRENEREERVFSQLRGRLQNVSPWKGNSVSQCVVCFANVEFPAEEKTETYVVGN